jgi:hypothetical protein
MDESLRNLKNIQKYEKINLEINVERSKVKELKEIVKEGLSVDIKKELEYKKEQTKLEKIINNLEEYLIIIGISVPNNKGYEVLNGLTNMKRDVNLKLVFYLLDDENKIRQVFLLFIFNIV